MANEPGRPTTTDETLQKWLEDLIPFLKLGQALNTAIEEAGLSEHRTTIYDNYRLRAWFSYKINIYQSIPGKIANNILVRILMQVDEKLKQGLPVTEDEMKNVRFFAEKHRSAQQYFVNRQETAAAKPIEEILDEVELKNESVDDVAEQAKKQVVAPEQSIPHQE